MSRRSGLGRRLEDRDRLIVADLRGVDVGEHQRRGDVARSIGQDTLELGDRVALALAGYQQPGQG